MLFIKLYKLKNPLTLERVTKPIGIRLLNDIIVTKNSTEEKISLDLSEIDDIDLLELTTSEVLRPSKPPKLKTNLQNLFPNPSKNL